MELLVSIVITTFNRCGSLERAIRSALNQTYLNTEIIVVDDGSTDNTSTFMEAIQSQHNHVKYLCNDRNRGSNYCRNYGVKNALGYFIAGLDDDDEFHPERVEKLVKGYSPEFAFISSLNERIIFEAVHYSVCKPIVTLNELLLSNCLMNQGLIERSRMLAVGLYDESLTACQDYDMWIRLCRAFGNVKVVQEYLQKIYERADVQRISNGGHKTFKGYLGFYRKYKSQLSTVQKQNFLFTIYRVKNKKLAFWSFRALLSSINEDELIKYYHKSKSALCDYLSVQNVTKKIEMIDKNQSYILYGYGSLGKVAHMYLQNSIVAIIDEGLMKKQVTSISNTPLISLQNLAQNVLLNNLTVLITPINHSATIKESLKVFDLECRDII